MLVDKMVGMANGTAVILAMLVSELDKKGVVSKSEFASLLNTSADDADRDASPELQKRERYDLFLMRNVAHLLATPPSQWKPVLIEGGLKDDPEKQ